MYMPLYRRQFGLILGALTGFAAGLVLQGINPLLMPGVPLYQPPFGAVVNTLLCLITGALLGVITAWPDIGIKGILLGTLFGTLILVAITLITGPSNSEILSQKAVVLVLILAPLMGLLAPVLILFRWIVSREEVTLLESKAGFQISNVRRWAVPALLVTITGLLGLFAIQPEMARAVLPQMHTLIQMGQQEQNAEALPEPLKSEDVTHFLERGMGRYVLEWQKDDQNQYMVKRPLAPLDQQSIVIAHYDNGYVLICRFPGKTGQPNCRDF
jgi:hypothetical protein